MEHIIVGMLICSAGLLTSAITLHWARRQFTKKRNDYRMGQALRRGLTASDGVGRAAVQVVQWQSCESTSTHWS